MDTTLIDSRFELISKLNRYWYVTDVHEELLCNTELLNQCKEIFKKYYNGPEIGIFPTFVQNEIQLEYSAVYGCIHCTIDIATMTGEFSYLVIQPDLKHEITSSKKLKFDEYVDLKLNMNDRMSWTILKSYIMKCNKSKDAEISFCDNPHNYVSYYTAEKLAKIGFNVPVEDYYDKNRQLQWAGTLKRFANETVWSTDLNKSHKDGDEIISAPLLYDAASYLRKMFNIFVTANCINDTDGEMEYHYVISIPMMPAIHGKLYTTPELALDNGIYNAIDLI